MNQQDSNTSQDNYSDEFQKVNMNTPPYPPYPHQSADSQLIQQRLHAKMATDNGGDQLSSIDHKSNNNSNSQINEERKSLSEKLRTHYREGSSAGSKAKVFARVLFQVQAVTLIFMAVFYLAPWALEEYDLVTNLSCILFFIYIFIMCESNWYLSIVTESDLPETIPDIPPLSAQLKESSMLSVNPQLNSIVENVSAESSNTNESSSTIANSITLPRIDRFGMMWKFCDICNRFRPPRTYHCKFCRKCILRRDHHCHLVGKCIGHYNQRFFVVLCFYTMLASAIGFPITCSYLSSHLKEAYSWTWYVFPYTFFLFLFRYVSLKFVILTFNAYLTFIFGILSLLYWLSQLSLISMGKTLVEVIKQMDVKVTSSLSENFHVVFGNNWLLSFLIPMPTMFKQTHAGIWFQKVKIYRKNPQDI